MKQNAYTVVHRPFLGRNPHFNRYSRRPTHGHRRHSPVWHQTKYSNTIFSVHDIHYYPTLNNIKKQYNPTLYNKPYGKRKVSYEDICNNDYLKNVRYGITSVCSLRTLLRTKYIFLFLLNYVFYNANTM